MTESWRRKAYYDKRVLLDVDRILDPQFDDILVCLTGAQVEMLRNMMQYLHRRSTFVSEYENEYYLAPTSAQWDTLQDIVADLELTLMGCPEIVAQLEAIANNLACLCSASSGLATREEALPTIINYYLEDDALIPDDPYWGDIVVDADRCALAQLVYAQAWRFITEIFQPAGVSLMTTMLPLAMGALATMIGTPILGVPIATITAAIGAFIAVDTAGSIEELQNVLASSKDELICAVYYGLAVDYSAAFTGARGIIDSWSTVSSIDKALCRLMFQPWATALMQKALSNATTWALLNITDGFCDDCETDPDLWIREWNFPPCPGVFLGTFPCSSYECPGLNGGASEAYTATWSLADMASHLDVRIEVDFFSKFGYGWTVGYANVQVWTAGAWVNRWGATCTTLEPIGSATHTVVELEASPRVDDLFRLRLTGQPGQGDEDPWPFNPVRVRVQLTTPEP